MTDPASPAAVTITPERIAEIRKFVAPLTRDDLPPESWIAWYRDLLAAYDARGLELARQEAKLADFARMTHLAEEQALGAEDRLAQANEALRNAFPHFANQEDVTPEQIAQIGSEYTSMMMDEGPQEITFADQDGTLRKIVFSHGDEDAGVASGWEIPEDADWVVSTPPAQSAGEALDPAGTGEGLADDEVKLITWALTSIEPDGTSEVPNLAEKAAALILRQASALAGARADALREAADMCARFDDCGPAFIAQRLRDTATRLTEPQHGNG